MWHDLVDRRRRALRSSDDAGYALLMTLFALLVMTGVLLGILGASLRSLTESRDSRDHESGIAAAEGAAEALAQHVDADPTYLTVTNGVVDTLPANATPAQQKAFVQALYAANLAANATSIVPVPGGRTFAVHPLDAGTGKASAYVFGMAVIGTQHQTVRVVRMSLSRSTFTLTQAIVTEQNLTVSGHGYVLGAVGGAHSNGNLSVNNTAIVLGQADASGTRSCTSGGTCATPATDAAASGVAKVVLPDVRAEDYYFVGAQRPLTWYDLCPDGKVHRWNAAGPCTGAITVLAGMTRGTGSNGMAWTHWVVDNGVALPGNVLFAYRGSLEVINNCSGSAVLMASRDAATNDYKQGNIVVGDNVTVVPAAFPGLPPFYALADRDLWMTNNHSLASQSISVAGEQIKLDNNGGYKGTAFSLGNKYWGGAVHTAGSPVSADQVTNNATITYDGGLSLTPLRSPDALSGWTEL